MSSESRNYRYGLALGKQQSFDKNITVEGTSTSSAIILKAKEFKLDTPEMAAINNLPVTSTSGLYTCKANLFRVNAPPHIADNINNKIQFIVYAFILS